MRRLWRWFTDLTIGGPRCGAPHPTQAGLRCEEPRGHDYPHAAVEIEVWR